TIEGDALGGPCDLGPIAVSAKQRPGRNDHLERLAATPPRTRRHRFVSHEMSWATKCRGCSRGSSPGRDSGSPSTRYVFKINPLRVFVSSCVMTREISGSPRF